VRRASCGHYIAHTAKPAAFDPDRGEPIFLCDACKAALKRRPIERKA
jgi:hypothetical protein